MSRPPGFTEDEAWARARELLTDINPSAKPATLRANQLDGGQLQVGPCAQQLAASHSYMCVQLVKRLQQGSSSRAAPAAAWLLVKLDPACCFTAIWQQCPAAAAVVQGTARTHTVRLLMSAVFVPTVCSLCGPGSVRLGLDGMS